MSRFNFKEVEERIKSHPAVNNDFFQRAKSQPWTQKELCSFASEYYAWVRLFPRMLATLIGQTTDYELLAYLSSILSSELGYGRPDYAHYHLLEDALKRVGVKRECLSSGPKEQFTKKFLAELSGLYESKGSEYQIALGAQYALEVQADKMLRQLGDGFRDLLSCNVGDIAYFQVHLNDEPEHARAMRHAVESILLKGEEPQKIHDGISRCLNLIADFWSGCAELVDKSSPK